MRKYKNNTKYTYFLATQRKILISRLYFLCLFVYVLLYPLRARLYVSVSTYYRRIITLLHRRIVALSHCRIVRLSDCHIVALLYYHIVALLLWDSYVVHAFYRRVKAFCPCAKTHFARILIAILLVYNNPQFNFIKITLPKGRISYRIYR